VIVTVRDVGGALNVTVQEVDEEEGIDERVHELEI
jgi:hypothetical protein